MDGVLVNLHAACAAVQVDPLAVCAAIAIYHVSEELVTGGVIIDPPVVGVDYIVADDRASCTGNRYAGPAEAVDDQFPYGAVSAAHGKAVRPGSGSGSVQLDDL